MVGLLGVVLGFSLAVGYQEIRAWFDRRAIRSSLLAELRSNLYLLPQKADTIRKVLKTLNEGRLLSAESVNFCTTIYTHHYPALSWRFSAQQRNSLHVIYEYFRLIDSSFRDHSEQILRHAESHILEDVIGIQIAKMNDLHDLLGVAETLIQCHLSGKPEDVLHIDRDYTTIKNAKFA
jgi:hypothetical protein